MHPEKIQRKKKFRKKNPKEKSILGNENPTKKKKQGKTKSKNSFILAHHLDLGNYKKYDVNGIRQNRPTAPQNMDKKTVYFSI